MNRFSRYFGLSMLAAFLALWAAAPARAQYEPPKQMTLAPTGVDLTTGRFTYKATDLSIGPFTLERSYVGGHAVDGSSHFGLNWTHNHSIYVVEKDRTKYNGVYVVTGRDVIHFRYSSGVFTCAMPECMGMTLEIVNAAFVFKDRQGNVFTFNPSVNAFPPPTNITPTLRNQRIARIDYAGGHTLTFTYANSQLKQVASNYGYSLVFDHQANGYISKACGYNRAVTQVSSATTCAGATLVVSYGYAPSTWVNLTSVTDVMNQAWGYDYVGNSNVSKMTCVRQVNSSSCLITNNFAGASGTVLQQTRPDSSIWNHYVDQPVKVSYDDPQLPGELPPQSSGSYTGPEGIAVTAAFGGGLLDSYSDSGRITQLKWNGIELESLTHHEGNNVVYFRDLRQNPTGETWSPKPGSTGVTAVSNGIGYPEPTTEFCPVVGRTLCNRPIWREDYKGNRTSFTYEPHGGVKTETGPAVGGVAPQVRYEYVARKAWVLSGGVYAQESVPIYLPSRKAFCATGNASGWGCALTGDEVVTTYDYGPDSGPNNLALRSETVTAGGVIRRTCYGYDWMGNRISTTRPNGLCQ